MLLPLQALCGPRVYTFFLYLSDVEEGGGTRFPHIKGDDGETAGGKRRPPCLTSPPAGWLPGLRPRLRTP